MKRSRSSIYWINQLPFIPIPFGREWGSAFATKPRPKLATCLVKPLLLANHPTLKLQSPCPKQRAHVERQHCVRKILFVSLVSNLSGALEPIWRWQDEVWLTALCENLRARNGCIESLDDISWYKWHRITPVCRGMPLSCKVFSWFCRGTSPLSLVSVAQQSHRQQTYTAPLKHAAWFEDLTLCTRYLVLVSWSKCSLLQSHGFWALIQNCRWYQFGKTWKPSQVSSLLLLLPPLHSRSNCTLQKGMKRSRSSIYWINQLPFIPIPFGREWGSAFATKPRPKLATCLVKPLLLANHPTLKLQSPCPKQRAHVERQHCVRKILFVSLVSNLSGALEPIWRWQDEVWLTALCENLRARNGCIESLDDISWYKWHRITPVCRGMPLCCEVFSWFCRVGASQ